MLKAERDRTAGQARGGHAPLPPARRLHPGRAAAARGGPHRSARSAKNTTIRKMMADIEDGLRGGETLSDCFDRHPKVFPEFYRGILRSAELTGQLDTVLDQLAGYLERDLEARRKIKSASIYPAIIAVMSLVTVVVLAVFVLPRFKIVLRLAATPSCRCRPGCCWPSPTSSARSGGRCSAGSSCRRSLLFAGHRATDGGRHAWDRLLLQAAGDRRDDPVRPGRAVLPDPRLDGRRRGLAARGAAGGDRVAAQPGLHAARWPRVGEPMLEGEGLAQPLAGTGLFPATAAADDPGRRGDRHARHPARGDGPLLRAASWTTRSRS